ncbi:MAG: DUF805 domain-containing protein [Devosia sp.]
MSDVFPSDAAATPRPRLRDEAGARRIGRGRYIGNSIGIALLIAAIAVGLSFTPLGHEVAMADGAPPQRFLSPIPLLVLAVIGIVALCDLMVRRRHDRSRSGADAVVFAMLAAALVAIHAFGKAPDLVLYLDAGLGLYGLYLLVVLVILPGTRGENAYGAGATERRQD